MSQSPFPSLTRAHCGPFKNGTMHLGCMCPSHTLLETRRSNDKNDLWTYLTPVSAANTTVALPHHPPQPSNNFPLTLSEPMAVTFIACPFLCMWDFQVCHTLASTTDKILGGTGKKGMSRPRWSNVRNTAYLHLYGKVWLPGECSSVVQCWRNVHRWRRCKPRPLHWLGYNYKVCKIGKRNLTIFQNVSRMAARCCVLSAVVKLALSWTKSTQLPASTCLLSGLGRPVGLGWVSRSHFLHWHLVRRVVMRHTLLDTLLSHLCWDLTSLWLYIATAVACCTHKSKVN